MPEMPLIGRAHSKIVFERRVRVLSAHICRALPQGAKVLDVGCGDGTLDSLILAARPDVSIHGIDVLVRPQTRISVTRFDGTCIPFETGTFDVVLFVDVLHHTRDPLGLMREASRVSRRTLVIKDHTKDGVLAGPTLRLMDWVGNAHHGVVLPYNYWPESSWKSAFKTLDLLVEHWSAEIGLYPWPANLLFDRRLHFVATLGKGRPATG
jgi:SAM-dependent methyltransferase